MPKKLTLEYVRKEIEGAGYTLVSEEYGGASSPLEIVCDRGHRTTIKWGSFKQGCRCNVCFGTKKYSYGYVRRVFEKEGYRLVSKSYESNKRKLEYICLNGHRSSISFYSFLKGQRCAYCYGNVKYTIDEVRRGFSDCGFELLSMRYEGNHALLHYKCSEGHMNRMSFSNLKSGWGCPDCSGNKKHTIEEFEGILSKEGYTLLSSEYTNRSGRVSVLCPKGHRTTKSWGDLLSGYGCIICARKNKKTLDEIREYFSDYGYILISDEYKNNYTKLDFICPKGHEGRISWHEFSSGNRCGTCAHNRKKTYAEVKEVFEREGYTLLSNEYSNSHRYLVYECPSGHINKTKAYRFFAGGRCPDCFLRSSRSREEIDLCGCICRRFGDLEILNNVRDVIPPKELDIYIPSKGVAIEYCGVYWHSSATGTGKYYHKEKMDACYAKGIRLITVFGDEFTQNKHSVLDVIFSIVEDPNVPIYSEYGDFLVSDLRYDCYGSASFYKKKGFNMSGLVGPVSRCISSAGRVDEFIPGKDRIYDCGRVIYRR